MIDAYAAAQGGRDDELDWVRFHVANLVHLDRRDEAWRIIVSAIERTTDPQALCSLGAGDLENLIVFHGADWIDDIERQAAASHNFKQALQCVWGGDPEIRARLDRILRD